MYMYVVQQIQKNEIYNVVFIFFTQQVCYMHVVSFSYKTNRCYDRKEYKIPATFRQLSGNF